MLLEFHNRPNHHYCHCKIKHTVTYCCLWSKQKENSVCSCIYVACITYYGTWTISYNNNYNVLNDHLHILSHLCPIQVCDKGKGSHFFHVLAFNNVKILFTVGKIKTFQRQCRYEVSLLQTVMVSSVDLKTIQSGN